MHLSVMLVLLPALCFTKCRAKIEQSEDGTSGTISFTTPDLNDEEEHSLFMPDMLKCDACRAIAYQLFEKFRKVNEKMKSLKYNLPESEVLDAAEAVCQNKDTFDGYGIKQVKKVKRLSGPGLETSEEPGIMQGGGKWPGRMMDMCDNYMGEIGEMEVYQAFKEKPKNLHSFENFLCRGDGILGECLNMEKLKKEKDEL